MTSMLDPSTSSPASRWCRPAPSRATTTGASGDQPTRSTDERAVSRRNPAAPATPMRARVADLPVPSHDGEALQSESSHPVRMGAGVWELARVVVTNRGYTFNAVVLVLAVVLPISAVVTMTVLAVSHILIAALVSGTAATATVWRLLRCSGRRHTHQPPRHDARGPGRRRVPSAPDGGRRSIHKSGPLGFVACQLGHVGFATASGSVEAPCPHRRLYRGCLGLADQLCWEVGIGCHTGGRTQAGYTTPAVQGGGEGS
jgi:hypothetical protein